MFICVNIIIRCFLELCLFFSVRLYSLTIKLFFIFKFVFYSIIAQLIISYLGHYLTHYPGIGFPFVLSFFLVIFKEVVVGFKDWKLRYCQAHVWNGGHD